MLCSPTFAMPQMDGLELLTKIRDRWPDSRVVVHSNRLTWRVARLARVEGHMRVSPSPTNRSAPQDNSVSFFWPM